VKGNVENDVAAEDKVTEVVDMVSFDGMAKQPTPLMDHAVQRL
jgi:hypothetical protein